MPFVVFGVFTSIFLFCIASSATRYNGNVLTFTNTIQNFSAASGNRTVQQIYGKYKISNRTSITLDAISMNVTKLDDTMQPDNYGSSIGFGGGLKYTPLFNSKLDFVGNFLVSNTDNFLPQFKIGGGIKVKSIPAYGIIAIPRIDHMTYRNGTSILMPSIEVIKYFKTPHPYFVVQQVVLRDMISNPKSQHSLSSKLITSIGIKEKFSSNMFVEFGRTNYYDVVLAKQNISFGYYGFGSRLEYHFMKYLSGFIGYESYKNQYYNTKIINAGFLYN